MPDPTPSDDPRPPTSGPPHQEPPAGAGPHEPSGGPSTEQPLDDSAAREPGGGPVRRWLAGGRSRRRGVVIAAGVAAVLVVVAVVVVVLGGDRDLPAPRTLSRDPVPAERIRTFVPPGCGVTGATLDALTPDPSLHATGAGGECEWASGATKRAPGLRLEVSLRMAVAGPGRPNANNNANSSAAAAMVDYTGTMRSENRGRRLVSGLGEEAFVANGPPILDPTRRVVFRTGNVVGSVKYSAEDHTSEYEPVDLPVARLHDGAFRAAADIARGLGAPAHPKEAVPAAAPRPVRLPRSPCDLVPKDLRDRLVGTDAEEEKTTTTDPGSQPDVFTRARTAGCELMTPDRQVTVSVTTSDTAAELDRAYLRRYLEARAQPPISARDDRYFHALSGLGDRAFCAYLQESDYPGLSIDDPARITIRTGNALITITYGSDHNDAEVEPLTRDESINGAYAVATHTVNTVTP